MATSVQTGKAKQLTLLGFFAITASMVMAVYEYPTFATSGFSLVFFLLLGGILWFIPVGLCAAEMATVDGWEEGGVFAWVSNTLGPRWGFAAISFGYLQIAIGFIPMLYFVLGALSYILKWPALNEDPITKTIAALIILWALALTQFGGTKYTARIAKVGFFAGILLPAFILIALAAIYLHSGAPVAIEMDAKTFFPDFSKVGTLVVFVAFILSYMGVEASATHVNEMSNPGRDYPLAMLLLMVAAICLSSVGGLSIAMVIPGNEINLSALLLLGVLAEIASWIVGPSRGMYVTAQKNLLPAAFAKMNKNGVPVTLVISQLVITSIALIILTNTGGGNNMSFLIALALTVVIYLCAYFMLFIGYIVLVLKHPDLKRTFNIPGGKGVKLVVAIVGLLTSIMAFIVSFLPPDNIQGDSTDMYVELLVVSFLVVLALPFILYAVHDRKSKANTGVTLEPINSQNAPKGHFFLHPRARSPHYIVMNDKKH
ncbi:acid resistance gamma-aminobutyrate antiporter GadC [Escherichia coli]|nr:acid resistance gamma-aminobutyrate antiporter GadC [Escherichia coli]